MQNILLKYNGQAVLDIKKTEKGFYGNLFVGDTLLKTISSEMMKLDLSNYEGKKLPVILQNKHIFYENKDIAELETVFDNVLGKVGQLNSNSEKAVVCIFGEDDRAMPVSELIDVEDLPKGLFDRRNQFPVRIFDDENWEIVRYANLHQHTDASLLDGMVKIDDLVVKTEWAAAVTDHGHMHAFNEFYHKMKKAKKVPIIGCEVYVETIGGTPRQTLALYEENKKDDYEGRLYFVDKNRASVYGSNRSHETTLAGEHMILLVETEEGLHNLFKLVTEASEHFYKHPHVTWDMLEKYHTGLIATSACIAGTLGQSVKEILKCEDFPELERAKEVKKENRRIARTFIQEMIRLFGKENFYIELQNHHFPLEAKIMEEVKKYAKKYDLKTTVGIDAHYLNASDAKVHEMWLANQTKTTMRDPNRMTFSGDGYYVHTSNEVISLFPDDLDALDNTLEIAERCSKLELKNEGYHLPVFPLPDGYTNDNAYLRHLIYENFKRLWNEKKIGVEHTEEERQRYLDRIDTEMKTIHDMGWESYFLVVQDFIRYAQDTNVKEHLETYFPKKYYDWEKIPESVKNKDYEVYIGTGRGSAAGSLVCCCLGITKVDPIKYDLLFERFLSPDRISMPDIDTDFEDSTREQVIEYCRVKYGADHVSRIVTFGTAAAKNALKTIARVEGKPVALGELLANAVPDEAKTIDEAEEMNPEFRTIERDDEKAEIVKNAKRIEGLSTNRSIHACGVLIADKPVVEYMPQLLMKNPRGDSSVWTTELQGPECEEMGLLKMDFLGLITLGIAHETIVLIKKNHGVEIIYDEIPLDDIGTYCFMADGHTSAVFQAESQIFTKTLVGALGDLKKRIRNIELQNYSEKERREEYHRLGEEMFLRVSDCNALVRPGPNQYVDQYNEIVKKGPSFIKYDDISMVEYLKSTNGIMLYQEQVMLLCRKMAGFSAGQADTVRKAMGKKKREILDKFAEYFVTGSTELGIKGCVANGIPEAVARKVWADMEKFAGYAFNKSHAVAYSMHTVRTAWLAKNYYEEYMTAVLNANIKKSDKIRGYISEIKKNGVSILAPSINESESQFSTDGKSIRFGLSGIKGLGVVGEKIIDERNRAGKFESYADFLARMAKHQTINSTAIKALIVSGCLDEFDNSSRKAKLDGIDAALDLVASAKQETKVSTMSLFDLFDESNSLIELDYDKTIPEMRKEALLDMEYNVTGFYMSGHPMDRYETYLKGLERITPIFDIQKMFEASNAKSNTVKLNIAGVLKDVEKKYDKNKNSWWTVKVEDRTGVMSGRFFCKKETDVLEINALMNEGRAVVMRGNIKDSGYGPEISIEFIDDLQKMAKETK